MTDKAHKSTFKEMVTSITIAFILAFVFRAFVIEAFVIPTGSMAPTLMGQHVRFVAPYTGYEFASGPTDVGAARPARLQTGEVRDLMMGPSRAAAIQFNDKPIRAGDRILVLKYLMGVFDPKRFDVVVFKSPVDPQTNFIKRLIGLTGEQIALIDGDVFVRDEDLPPEPDAPNSWSQSGWTIARKPERVQRAVWQDVFNSFNTPDPSTAALGVTFSSPWSGDGWDTSTSVYRCDRAASVLTWDDERWPIRDRYPYNETTPSLRRNDDKFSVSDLRVRAGIEPDDADACSVAAIITARSHEFRARIAGGNATISMRPVGGDWADLASEAVALGAGVTNVEFWHVDQTLELWIDGRRVARAEYDWSPAERIYFSSRDNRTIDQLLATGRATIFTESATYQSPAVRWEFNGSPLTLHRVGLQRDLHYQASRYGTAPGAQLHARHGEPSAGSHPDQPIHLTKRQYFCCGDNSPSSSDGRLWDSPDPWVAQIDDSIGVVARELMIGRAFFVYFPSPLQGRFGLPIPDAGRLRLIW